MWDFIKQHFDKMLLAFFVLYFSALGWHAIFYMSHHAIPDAIDPVIRAFMDSMLDNQKLVIGALLGLITGRALSSIKNGNGAKNGTTTPSNTTPPPNPVV